MGKGAESARASGGGRPEQCRSKLIKLLKNCESTLGDIDSFYCKLYNLATIPGKVSVSNTQKPGRKNFL